MYTGYDTNYPYQYLLSKGYDATLHCYSQKFSHNDSESTCNDRLTSAVSRYRKLTANEIEAISNVVHDCSEDGMIYDNREIRMGMLTWKSR